MVDRLPRPAAEPGYIQRINDNTNAQSAASIAQVNSFDAQNATNTTAVRRPLATHHKPWVRCHAIRSIFNLKVSSYEFNRPPFASSADFNALTRRQKPWQLRRLLVTYDLTRSHAKKQAIANFLIELLAVNKDTLIPSWDNHSLKTALLGLGIIPESVARPHELQHNVLPMPEVETNPVEMETEQVELQIGTVTDVAPEQNLAPAPNVASGEDAAPEPNPAPDPDPAPVHNPEPPVAPQHPVPNPAPAPAPQVTPGPSAAGTSGVRYPISFGNMWKNVTADDVVDFDCSELKLTTEHVKQDDFTLRAGETDIQLCQRILDEIEQSRDPDFDKAVRAYKLRQQFDNLPIAQKSNNKALGFKINAVIAQGDLPDYICNERFMTRDMHYYCANDFLLLNDNEALALSSDLVRGFNLLQARLMSPQGSDNESDRNNLNNIRVIAYKWAQSLRSWIGDCLVHEDGLFTSATTNNIIIARCEALLLNVSSIPYITADKESIATPVHVMPKDLDPKNPNHRLDPDLFHNRHSPRMLNLSELNSIQAAHYAVALIEHYYNFRYNANWQANGNTVFVTQLERLYAALDNIPAEYQAHKEFVCNAIQMLKEGSARYTMQHNITCAITPFTNLVTPYPKPKPPHDINEYNELLNKQRGNVGVLLINAQQPFPDSGHLIYPDLYAINVSSLSPYARAIYCALLVQEIDKLNSKGDFTNKAKLVSKLLEAYQLMSTDYTERSKDKHYIVDKIIAVQRYYEWLVETRRAQRQKR